jgi:nicotinic acid mononucleotide adenylyltransferase
VQVELCDEVAEFLARHQLASLPERLENGRGNILWLETTVVDVSSTQVRQAIKEGERLDQLLPEAVEHLIRENGYYGYQ